MKIITRFAPSPTGLFHAGSYRTALFSYIFARQNEGKFILRIEDTDKERSKREYEENILDSLKWLGLDYDECYKQSERTEIYKKYIRRLIDQGNAYISKETPKEEGDRTEVVRFKNPNIVVSFIDLIRGKIEFNTTELGDFVIAKSLNEPVFHLVNVIDDYEMGITHIIRGEDHISNTPRQILIFEAIGAKPPQYAHIPLLLGSDRSKLSKRKGAHALTEYREKGFVPAALINYLSLLGWHPVDDTEIMNMKDILKTFSLDRVQKAGAIFDEEKLRWFNRQYISQMSESDFTDLAKIFIPEWLTSSSAQYKALLPILKEKITIFSDISDILKESGELGFIRKIGDYNSELLLWKKNPNREVTEKHLVNISNIINKMNADNDSFTAENIKSAIWNYALEYGKGDVLWPFRVSLTGKEKSPDPFACASILGKDESLRRLSDAIVKLE